MQLTKTMLPTGRRLPLPGWSASLSLRPGVPTYSLGFPTCMQVFLGTQRCPLVLASGP